MNGKVNSIDFHFNYAKYLHFVGQQMQMKSDEGFVDYFCKFIKKYDSFTNEFRNKPEF